MFYNLVMDNQISLASEDTEKDISAYIESVAYIDNRYFLLFDRETPSLANKVARIRIDIAEYVDVENNWILSIEEKKILMRILTAQSMDYLGCTKWQDILIEWNRVNFGIPARDTMSGNIQNYQPKSGLLNTLKPFDINTPMPNYLDL